MSCGWPTAYRAVGRRGLRSVTLAPALSLGLWTLTALVVDRLGFLPTAAAMVLATALTFGARWRLAVSLAVLAPLLVHLVFYKLLRVPLPAGLLPAPWAAA